MMRALIKVTLVDRLKGTLIFDAFYAFHTHKVISSLHRPTYYLPKGHVFEHPHIP